MAWTGYFTLGGTEIINVARVEAYAKSASMSWFKPVYRNEALGPLLGQTYRSPLQDSAPWADEGDDNSLDFMGFYPLNITGLEDSTAEATVTENVFDGGVVGRVRHGTKSIVFSGVLIATSECGVEYGMRWLKEVLNGGACMGPACGGVDMCYLSCEPFVDFNAFASTNNQPISVTLIDGGGVDGWDDPTIVDGGSPIGSGSTPINGGEPGGWPTTTTGDTISFIDGDCIDDYMRSLRQVAVTSGPSITNKMKLTDGSVAWSIQFTAVAGNPYEFSGEQLLIDKFMASPDPYVGGIPEGGVFDDAGYVQQEVSCSVSMVQPLFDPVCAAVVTPPPPPSVPIGCFTAPQNWKRRGFVIPALSVPEWGEIVPKINLHAGAEEVRNVRIRFYDTLDDATLNITDQCAFCGEMLVSYIPVNSTLVLDGSDQVVYVESEGGVRRRADSLVFRTDGTPFEWPTLSCGYNYIVTVDMPQTQTPPAMDLSLFQRVR
jgi:hypothetical protein